MYNKLVSNMVNVNIDEVSCQGNEAPYGHPLIYLKIDKNKKSINCPYCSKQFNLIK